MDQCSRCGHYWAPDSPRSNLDCPNCGLRFVPALSHSEASGTSGARWIRDYFGQLKQILTRPADFFDRLPLRGGVAYPLAFALITHWLGSALGFLWKAWVGGAVSDYFQRIFRIAGDMIDIDQPGRTAQIMEIQSRLVHWFWGVGSVIADPFITLISILFTSLFVFVGARILVTPGKEGAPATISYESALRLICFGMAPAILAGLPIFGGVVSSLLVAVITIIGARQIYRVGTARAMIIALFPKLLFIAIIILGLAVFALTIVKFFASMF